LIAIHLAAAALTDFVLRELAALADENRFGVEAARTSTLWGTQITNAADGIVAVDFGANVTAATWATAVFNEHEFATFACQAIALVLRAHRCFANALIAFLSDRVVAFGASRRNTASFGAAANFVELPLAIFAKERVLLVVATHDVIWRVAHFPDTRGRLITVRLRAECGAALWTSALRDLPHATLAKQGRRLVDTLLLILDLALAAFFRFACESKRRESHERNQRASCLRSSERRLRSSALGIHRLWFLTGS
jgi:hypothetical protein